MDHRVTALAMCALVAAVSVPSLADAPHLLPGDTLTYDITIQVNERNTPPRASTSRVRTDSSAGAGTATLEIVGVDPDGTASGNLSVEMLGFAAGQPIIVRKTVAVKVAPNGEIHPSSTIDPLIDQALALADQSIRDIAGHDVHAQPSWQWRLPAATYPMTIAFDRVLRGEQAYQGLPTLIVQTTGSGQYAADADPVQASVSLAGTYYYDQRDGLFVGQAMRSDTTVADDTAGSVDASSLVTIVLRSFTRGQQPAATPSPAASGETEPTPAPATPAPTPVPNEVAPSPYPTVTLAPSPYPTVTPSQQ